MAISSALAGAVGAVPLGSVTAFAGSSAPSGWLLCYGQAVDRTQYSGLFAVISTTYGAGDGSTTFNVPDMRGRVPAGLDNMGGSAASRLTSGTSGISGTTLGAAGGNESVHQHTHIQNPHNHTQDSHNHTQYSHDHGGLNGRNFVNTNGDVVGSTAGSAGYLFAYSQATTATTTAINLATTATNQAATATNQNFGTGGSQNVQPTIVLNYIIKAQ